MIEEETQNSIKDMKKQVDDIKLNINNKDEILRELQRLQSSEDLLSIQLKEYEQKVAKQKNENQGLLQKLQIKQTEYLGIQQHASQLLEELKKEIKEKDAQIERLSHTKTIKQGSQSAKKLSTRNKSASKENENIALSKIMKELQVIKSFIMVHQQFFFILTKKPKEGEKSNSYLKVFRNNNSPKVASKSLLS